MSVDVAYEWQLIANLAAPPGFDDRVAALTGLSGGGFAAIAVDSHYLGGGSSGLVVADYRLQMYSANGSPTAAVTLSTDDSASHAWSVAQIGNGNVVVAGNDGYAIYSTTGAEIRPMSPYGSDGRSDIAPGVTVLAGGGFVIVTKDSGSSSDVSRYRIYNDAGVELAAIQIGSTSAATAEAVVTSLADGGFAVAWIDNNAVWTAVYNFDGTVRQGPLQVDASGYHGGLDIAAQVDGYAIVYSDSFLDSDFDVAMARYTNDGDFISYVTLSGGATIDGPPSIAAMPDGMYAVAWDYAYISDADSEVFVGLFDPASGKYLAIRDPMLGGEAATDDQDDILVAAHSGGRLAAFWQNGTDFDANGEHLLAVRSVTGDGAADNDIGSGFVDVSKMGEGNDYAGGAGGDDQLYGEGGDDQLQGGKGNDFLHGGGGANDVAHYGDATSGVSVSLALAGYQSVGGGLGSDNLLLIEGLWGSSFSDVLIGNDLNNRLHGGASGDATADKLQGGKGDDTYGYLSSNDLIIELAGEGIDTVEVDTDLLTYTLPGNVENLIFVHQGSPQGFDDVTANGNGLDNRIVTTFKQDKLYGLGGNDVLEGHDGGDTIDGGTGNDTASYANSDLGVYIDLLSGPVAGGHADGDTLVSIENVIGSKVADTLVGDDGANVLDGGDGDDFLVGYKGADTFVGGDGVDTVSYAGSNNGVAANLLTGHTLGAHATGDSFVSIEHLRGSGFADELLGNLADNNLFGDDGNDFLSGSNGDDRLDGWGGDDLLIGGAGADLINGGSSEGIGANMGTDEANYSTSDAAVQIDLATEVHTGGHAQGDTLVNIEIVTGSAFGDVLTGRSSGFWTGATEVFNGGKGDDLLVGSLGADRLNGNEGVDTVDYSGSGAAVSVVLFTGVGAGAGSFAEGDLLTNVENLTGTAFADKLTGSVQDNVLRGGAGNDEFNASNGNDQILGEGGDDQMVGGAGGDTFDGGSEIDWVYYSNADAGVAASLATGTGTAGHALGDTFASVENLYGSAFNDTLAGDGNANTLSGAGGSDTLIGGGGADVLLGGAGDDELEGGAGDDTLSGYTGANDYNYNSTTFGHDTIIGFQNGIDQIDLNAGMSFASFTETAHAGGTKLTLIANTANSIWIQGVNPSLIDASDFI